MKITLPLSVTLPRKTKADKVWILNINNYRNTHYLVLNAAKIAWKGVVNVTPGVHIGNPPYRFTYTVFPETNRKFDLANVLSIVQKFTDDCLIELKVIQDDNYKVIPVVVYLFGHVDKENPRVELEIQSITDQPIYETGKIAEELGL